MRLPGSHAGLLHISAAPPSRFLEHNEEEEEEEEEVDRISHLSSPPNMSSSTAAAARVGLADGLGCRNPRRWSEGTRLGSWTPSVLKRRRNVTVAAMTRSSGVMSNGTGGFLIKNGRDRSNDLPPVSPEKLDEWTRESVTEIVRNIGRAPFLVHLFSDATESTTNASRPRPSSSSSSSSSVRVTTEPVASQNWNSIKRKWELGDDPTPDGIILVEDITSDWAEEDGRSSGGGGGGGFAARSTNKTLGLLVQGRGVDCSACYILDTCRVLSSVGACTHFCLVRAKCFGDSPDLQLRNAWLQH